MFLNERTESRELLIFRSLAVRTDLSLKEKFYYSNLEKGFEGEVKFDRLLERLNGERLVICDLLLEHNHSHFQLDTILISQGTIYLFDVKNYEGDFYLDGDKLYACETNREYKNPIIQLKRSETLFRQLLQKHQYNFLIDPAVVFIHPEFTLYEAPRNQPFILPTQLQRFLKEIDKSPSRLNDNHKKLAQTLLSLRKTENPFAVLPEYRYEDLQKGVYCDRCKNFAVSMSKLYLTCKNCGHIERIGSAVIRMVNEFKLLFPNEKITTRNVYDWCRLDIHPYTMYRMLKKHFTIKGKTKNTYYV